MVMLCSSWFFLCKKVNLIVCQCHCSIRDHFCECWVIPETCRWDAKTFSITTLMLREWIIPPTSYVLHCRIPFDFCRPVVDVGVVFFLTKLYEDSLCWHFLLRKTRRVGTGIRSTHKPQRHVSPTDTHSLGVPAFVEDCFSIHFFYHFPLAVAVCVYPGLDS